MTIKTLVFLVFFVSSCLQKVTSHGRLMWPPARGSAWRWGFGTKRMSTDMGLNCGGQSHQWQNQKGRCGVCGDAFDKPQPRDQEAGGDYAPSNRPIVDCYKPGSAMDVLVEITATHEGYFEFRLCVNNDMTKGITQECLDQHLLTVHGTDETRYMEGKVNGNYTVRLDLPPAVTCDQCVLQWKWRTGNNWGCDETGCGRGKSKTPEMFFGCADISILDYCPPIEPARPVLNSSPTSTPYPTQAPLTYSPKTQAPLTYSPKTQAPLTYSPKTQAPWNQTPRTPAPTDGTSPKCIATGVYENRPDITRWCNENCPLGNCPSSHCECKSHETPSPLPPTEAPTPRPPTQNPYKNTLTYKPFTLAPLPDVNYPPPEGHTNSCVALGNDAGQWETQWCIIHCAIGYCPSKLCRCESVLTPTPSPTTDQPLSCEPTPNVSRDRNSKQWKKGKRWCIRNCRRQNGDCPPDRCNEDCRKMMLLRELYELI